jgi:TPR repeat protein
VDQLKSGRRVAASGIFESVEARPLNAASMRLAMEKLTPVGFAQLWKEAEKGNAQAQFMLAGALYNGNGRLRDPIEGAQWLLRSAEQGYTPAQCDLGAMYIKGAGVKQDYREAIKWLTKAAEKNDALAQHSVGSICAKGFRDKSLGFFDPMRYSLASATRDYVGAYKWFTLAAKNGHSQSLRDRALIAKMWMKDYQIERAERLVLEHENRCKQ